MIIDKEILYKYVSRYRALLINSLAGVKQAILIGTQSKDGQSNLALFNSLIHIGANPPLWGVVFRPDTVKRDTLTNILETNYYTLNFVSSNDVEKVHQTSAKYDTATSEFDACGFTEVFHPHFKAPGVVEAPIRVGMKLEQKIDITINNTILIIGSIEYIDIPERIISPDGFAALDQENLLACAGLDAYYETRLIKRLSYALPETWPTKK